MSIKRIDNLVIRTAVPDDLEQLLRLSELTGPGMTSMPTDRQVWVDKLDRSVNDFRRENPKINGDIYFLVMEDIETQELIGSGAFYAGIGLSQPFYSYKVTTLTNSSERLNLTLHTKVLNLVNDYSGATEIGSLFLTPEYRRDGIGKFLSRARFLLLADFPERFSDLVFAELRGWVDENNRSPFWTSLGRKFFGLSFQKADFISAVDGTQFISDLMPKYPVYLDLLPEDAQQVIGKPNDAARGALSILEREGFKHNGYVDIFDAGPTVEAYLSDIQTVKRSENVMLESCDDDDAACFKQAPHFILSNSKLKNYRMMRSPAVLTDDSKIILPQSVANNLMVSVGDKLRLVGV